jgi:hypothetical protein
MQIVQSELTDGSQYRLNVMIRLQFLLKLAKFL